MSSVQKKGNFKTKIDKFMDFTLFDIITTKIKMIIEAGHGGHVPITSTTWEAEDHEFEASLGKVSQTLSQKQKTKVWVHSQVVERLP
jgi:hypothetical protein